MRLRPLTEAECYARCYGAQRDEHVALVPRLPYRTPSTAARGEQLRKLFEERLDARPPEAEAA
jgi:hypothetical protein